MTRDQVYSAYKLYQNGWSVPRLAAAIWKKLGYRSQAACQTSLYEMFSSYKLKTRKPNEGKYAAYRCKGCGCSPDEKTRGCQTCSSRHSKRKQTERLLKVVLDSEATLAAKRAN